MAQFKIALLICGLAAAASARPQKSGRLFGTHIVGGEPATQGELPYQIDLRIFDVHICGGSLIIVNGQHVVITAAHCVDGWSPHFFTVTAGELSESQNSVLEQTRNVARIIVHEDYDLWLVVSNGVFIYENDIALLFLSEPFHLNADVAPIELPAQGQKTSSGIYIQIVNPKRGMVYLFVMQLERMNFRATERNNSRSAQVIETEAAEPDCENIQGSHPSDD